jgi:Txe/YoeB family toxin of Txe-Axe toxin-antitoxin module
MESREIKRYRNLVNTQPFSLRSKKDIQKGVESIVSAMNKLKNKLHDLVEEINRVMIAFWEETIDDMEFHEYHEKWNRRYHHHHETLTRQLHITIDRFVGYRDERRVFSILKKNTDKDTYRYIKKCYIQ